MRSACRCSTGWMWRRRMSATLYGILRAEIVSNMGVGVPAVSGRAPQRDLLCVPIVQCAAEQQGAHAVRCQNRGQPSLEGGSFCRRRGHRLLADHAVHGTMRRRPGHGEGDASPIGVTDSEISRHVVAASSRLPAGGASPEIILEVAKRQVVPDEMAYFPFIMYTEEASSIHDLDVASDNSKFQSSASHIVRSVVRGTDDER